MQGNEEAWASTFPQGLKYGDAKNGAVMKLGGLPPIWLVPPVNNQDKLLEATVTIKLTDKAKDTYVRFLGGSTEAAVCHVKLFYSLVKKLELVSQYEAKTTNLKDNRKLLMELGPITDSSPSYEIQQKQDLEEENKALL